MPGYGVASWTQAPLNEDEAPELLEWAIRNGYELNLIEQMPLDAQRGWMCDGMVTVGDISFPCIAASV